VRLVLIRLRAGDPTHRIGSLVVNPGGPGESGIDFVREAAATIFSPEIRARFDIVGFDPRGVGSSTPVHCLDTLDHFIPRDATAATPADLVDLLDGAKAFAQQCGQRNADLLPHLSTANVARDLDQIRAAIGDERLTYLGFSYGTLIGEDYASLFPTHIRALALDGVINPSLGEVAIARTRRSRSRVRSTGSWPIAGPVPPARSTPGDGRHRRSTLSCARSSGTPWPPPV
jgi:pimeloyl-ACP methyl ester carboxylesterase